MRASRMQSHGDTAGHILCSLPDASRSYSPRALYLGLGAASQSARRHDGGREKAPETAEKAPRVGSRRRGGSDPGQSLGGVRAVRIARHSDGWHTAILWLSLVACALVW